MLLEMLGGGLLRFAPEVLKFFDRKNERAHERSMIELSQKGEEARAAERLALQETQAEAVYNSASLQALISATEAQARPSGFRLVDAVSAAIRPTITLCYFGLYAGVRIASIAILAGSDAKASDIVAAAWTSQDMEIWGSILTFWFVDRAYQRMGRR